MTASLAPERSGSPGLKPYAAREKTPRLPPRPSKNATSDKDSSSLHPSPRRPAATKSPVPGNSSTNGDHAAQSPVSGFPARTSSPSPSPHPLATSSSSGKRDSDTALRATATGSMAAASDDLRGPATLATSPSLTPSSTGDYVLVPPASGSRRPPPLPPRATPTPKGSVDVHGSVSVGQVTPVDPHVTQTAAQAELKKPSPPVVPKKPVALRSGSTTG